MNLKQYIRKVPNFAKLGIIFHDVMTFFNNAVAFAKMVNQFGTKWADQKIDAKVAECGFIIHLSDLGGAAKINKMGVTVRSLIKFGGH